MPNYEQGVPLQTDQLSTVPGGSIRTIAVNTLVNGVMTPVQVQVVALCDPNGNLLDAPFDSRYLLKDLLEVMKDVRAMLSKLSEMPYLDDPEAKLDVPTLVSQ